MASSNLPGLIIYVSNPFALLDFGAALTCRLKNNFPPESLARQWAKELLQMLARPNSYEHDDTHGEWMSAYAQLLHGQQKKSKIISQLNYYKVD